MLHSSKYPSLSGYRSGIYMKTILRYITYTLYILWINIPIVLDLFDGFWVQFYFTI